VLADRSVQAVAGILGVLMAGAAYLPLDPAFPDERIAAILRDARPAAVLAQPDQAERLGPVVPVLTLEPGLRFPSRRAGRAATTTVPVVPDTGGSGSAYVIYTSGSTGRPKGVVVTHRGLASSTRARHSSYPGRPERFLLLSPLVFDSSVAGLFWTLAEGGTLILAPEGTQLEPAALARFAAARRPTHTLGVPSLFAALFEQGEPGLLQSLRILISAGESCPRDLLAEQRSRLPGCVLYNEYGPTENTVWSTVWSGEPLAYRSQLPIGRPVAGVRAYVLNPHQQPVPAGVTAELYLSGAGLARGYLGRPGLTAASFVPDPFRPGERMYRTGDLSRHTPDGDLEFLGRADGQVKIRGFRVEPAEIEGLLDGHPALRHAVVLARDDASGEKMLVAYVATSQGQAISGAEIQQYVRERLPRYMVPSACVVLEAMPLTATGKVDVASLPIPSRSERTRAEAVPPRTETEQLLAAIWCQVLDLDHVGARDEFFEIGGESLRAMQVVTKANKVFGLDLPVRSLFDAPTLESFARVVEDQAGRDQDTASTAIAREATPLR
jgi:nonribosomal peptide synthetase protein BlmX